MGFDFSSGVITGAPELTTSSITTDGDIENYKGYSSSSRRQLNSLLLNGTDIPSILYSLSYGVVGRDVRIQAKLNTDDLSTKFEEILETHKRSKYYSYDRSMGRGEFLRKIIHFSALHGGVIIRWHYTADREFPLSQELVGIDKIDTSKSDEARNIENGLKKNRAGEVTGIYLFTDAEKRESKLFSTKNLTYYFERWASISQYTAVSRLVSLLPELEAVTKYSSAEVDGAEQRASNGIFWKTELYAQILQNFSEKLQSPSLTKDQKSNMMNQFLARMAERDVGAGGTTPVPLGDDFFQPSSKTESVFDTFTTNFQQKGSSSAGVSAVSAYKDLSGSYATIKAVIASDEVHFQSEFDRLEDKIISEYLERMIFMSIQQGLLDINIDDYMRDPHKYHKWKVTRLSRKEIDENKAANAIAKKLTAGVTTKNLEYGKDGLDYNSEKRKQIDLDLSLEKYEIEARKNMGLEIPTNKEAV